MLVDEVQIIVKAGNGGNGSSSFKRNAQTARGGPDGGNGGKGGSVYVVGVNDIDALQTFRYAKKANAEDGINGGRQKLFGRNGQDLIIKVPFGTFIHDLSNNTTFEVIDEQSKHLIARGGKGGRGNTEFKSATNQAPKFAEKGEAGEEKRINLELKLIADVGLIGLPNAGKSSLLEVLTNAHPKIGNYPFTTLEPNLGVMEGLIIADIPGLIEGAHSGKGLGDKFLKHIERTKILVHCIDVSSNDPYKDYETIRLELKSFTETLLSKKEIILITKSDLISTENVKKFVSLFKKKGKEVLPVSIYDDNSLKLLKEKIRELIDK
ncbi:MAG: GTPase ObgE [Candidatus Levybacteria bacterium]|nr:GTPase ObgE [Candidatus Levybacteria bacterium]